MTKTNGFNKLKGIEVKDVNVLSTNHVMIRARDPKLKDTFLYLIESEVKDGEAVMTVKRYKEVMYKLPKTGSRLLFPFPK